MSRYLGSDMILVENWEEYLRRWSSEEIRVDDHGDDKEGGTGAVGASDGLWRRWPVATMVVEEPFWFFIVSAIWGSFWRFKSMESKEDWKWWILGFVGHDLVKKRRKDSTLLFSTEFPLAEKQIFETKFRNLFGKEKAMGNG